MTAAMKMFLKMLESNQNKTEADQQMIKMISGNYKKKKKKYLDPILDYIKN